MKKIILLFIFCSSVAFAQKNKYEKSLNGIKKVNIESDATITVVAGNTNELVIEEVTRSSNSDYWDALEEREEKWEEGNKKKKIDRKKGLKAIYPGGEDNTDGFGFSITTENGVLIVKDLKSHFQRSNVKITLPKTMNIGVKIRNLGSIHMKGFTSEVEANSNVGQINLKDVTGPITAHTSTGTVTVVFSSVSQSAPISISSAVGEIDVALPTNTKANLNLKTNATIYTNFDFKAEPKKGLKNISGLRKVNQEINGGGVNIKLHSAMGNIYLRKK